MGGKSTFLQPLKRRTMTIFTTPKYALYDALETLALTKQIHTALTSVGFRNFEGILKRKSEWLDTSNEDH
jgi:hypothetical protein